jgi:PBSX family phage terminase large subunit
MPNYTLLPKQIEFMQIPHDNDLDVAVYQGGFGSGKTFCGSLLGLLLARKFPGCHGLVGAKEYELVKNTTMDSYFEHLDAMGYVRDVDYIYNKNDKKITLSNGSTILFKGVDDPERFKSLNLHWIEVEECSQISHNSFKALLGRLRGSIKPDWEGFRYRLFGHTNPQPNKGWLWKVFIENPRDNYRLIIAPTSENKYLPEHFVQSLKDEYDPEYYRINVLGEFGNYSSGLVVKGFDDDNLAELTYNDGLDLYLTCDFNVDPMCWEIAHKDEDTVYFFDEIVIENTSTQESIDEFIRRYPNHKGKIYICGDASGDFRSAQSEFTNYMIIIRALQGAGYNPILKIRNFNPPVLRRIQSFNARVRNANNEVHILIDKNRCKWLLHNIYNLSFKEGTSIVDVPTVKQIQNDREAKFLEHPFDAASYLVEYFYPIK